MADLGRAEERCPNCGAAVLRDGGHAYCTNFLGCDWCEVKAHPYIEAQKDRGPRWAAGIEREGGAMAPDRNAPLTVGRLRELLAEHHESDIVLTSDHNLLYRLTVEKRPTAAGVVVLIERGERHVF